MDVLNDQILLLSALRFEFIKQCCFAGETILLAFQNYILMLGTNVMIPSLIVPAMGGDNVS